MPVYIYTTGMRRNYPYSEGDIFLVYDFQCSASATNISECSIQYFTDSNTCGHRNIAGVQCEGIRNLVVYTSTSIWVHLNRPSNYVYTFDAIILSTKLHCYFVTVICEWKTYVL